MQAYNEWHVDSSTTCEFLCINYAANLTKFIKTWEQKANRLITKGQGHGVVKRVMALIIVK